MIDLHTHTDESDGTYSPAQLVQAAVAMGLEALAITDHDTFAGYDKALPLARQAGLDLVCGIELSTRYQGRTVHLLGYFLAGDASRDFRDWLQGIRDARHQRNLAMAERLRTLGIDITIEEVQARGRSLAGRPHFARLLVEKGYVSSIQQAFDEYLSENGRGYVQRDEPSLETGIAKILEGGGIPSIAHPIRTFRTSCEEMQTAVAGMRDTGLRAIEVYHSDHGPAEVAGYRFVAEELDLAITGGSDFHGENKPRIELGTGHNNNLHIPREVLDRLRGSV